MTTHDTHPTDHLLTEFLQGQLRKRDRVAIESHIQHCESCSERLVQLDQSSSSDPLLQRMRNAVLLEVDDETPVPSATRVPEYLVRHPRWAIRGLFGDSGDGPRYWGLDRTTSKRVTLKVLACDSDADARLRQLCETLAPSAHPQMVAPYHVERFGADLVLVDEYRLGSNLREVICGMGRLTLATIMPYAQQVADVLTHSHQLGLTHGDLQLSDWLRNESTISLGGWDRRRRREPVPHDPRVDVLGFGLSMLSLLVGQTNLERRNSLPFNELWSDIPQNVVAVLRASTQSELDSPQLVMEKLHAALTPKSWWHRWSPF